MVWPINPHEPSPDPEYDASVRASVAAEIGSALADISDESRFIGRWIHSYSGDDPRSSRQRDYRKDGTYKVEGRKSYSRWRLEGSLYIESIWIDPMPEYDIPDGTWQEEVYHCAQSHDGRIVCWNGDASLVWTLSRVAG